MRATVIALPVAAGIALGGASLATGDPPEPKAPVERPAIVTGHVRPALPFLPEAEPFGLHSEIAADMAKELGLPEARVVAAMRAAIGKQFDRRRDEALKCFDDREKCAAAKLPPFLKVPPARSRRQP